MDEEQIHKEQIPDENNLDKTVKNSILPYLMDLSKILSIVLVLFLFCFRIAVVEGSSMYDTLVDGDYILLLNNFIAGDPKSGDIIVASKNSYKDGEPIIKRVIATEGQVVDIDFSTGEVTVDGVVLDEPYIHSATVQIVNSQSFPLTVNEGCLFVMGDNRGKSLDSRSKTIGLIDCREVVGKAILLIFPGYDEVKEERKFNRIGAIS